MIDVVVLRIVHWTLFVNMFTYLIKDQCLFTFFLLDCCAEVFFGINVKSISYVN